MKVQGKINDYIVVKEERNRFLVNYGMEPINETDATWFQLVFYKKQVGKPPFQMVKDAIIGDINTRITNHIVGGFVWEEKPVWYSLENQINFSQSVAPCNIKIGEYEDGSPVYVDFETKAALKAFNDACLAWKNECLESGRAKKEGIDWTPYEAFFPKEDNQE